MELWGAWQRNRSSLGASYKGDLGVIFDHRLVYILGWYACQAFAHWLPGMSTGPARSIGLVLALVGFDNATTPPQTRCACDHLRKFSGIQ